MYQCILYGITENAVKAIKKLEHRGVVPVCFCENNPTRNSYLDLPVLSVAEVREKYGRNIKVYVTHEEPEVYEIINTIIKEKVFCEDQILNIVKEKYKSCEALENELIVFEDRFSFCCGDGLVEHTKILPHIARPDNYDYDAAIEQIIFLKNRTIKDNKAGKKTCCTSCPILREAYWPKEKKIRRINISVDQPCNLRCTYCYKCSADYVPNFSADVLSIIDALMTSKHIDCNALEGPSFYAAGEISIHPRVEEIIDRLQKIDVAFFTNATVYNKRIHEIIKRPLCSAVISLDCGTRNTYKTIKGVDKFEIVCKNIKHYASEGGNVLLKYIVMENNTSTPDIEGFINLCLQCGIQNIRIARDWRYQAASDVSEAVKNAAMKIVRKARKYNIRCYTEGETVCHSSNG